MDDSFEAASGEASSDLLSALVGLIVSAVGLGLVGFPWSTLIHGVITFVVALAISAIATAISTWTVRSAGLSRKFAGAVKAGAVFFVSSIFVLILGYFGVQKSVEGIPSSSVPPAGVQAPRPSPVKASNPPNTIECPPSSSGLFQSVAADLGVDGLGPAGSAHWTSCEFARNVRDEYIRNFNMGEHGTISTTSPRAPDQGYIRMTCDAIADNMVKCSGGKGAFVYIY
ncbi:hypothetical protein JNN96_30515 [Mycobacterium sp. DSM 3803]|nr:hypothetical protein [Mycobacterium sp. DSM 3803]